MSELMSRLQQIDLNGTRPSTEVNSEVAAVLSELGYDIALYDYDRPWGGFNQLENDNADKFVAELPFGVTSKEAQLGIEGASLSPKILATNGRLSWQYHDRRAERWLYLTPGGYFKSANDQQGELQLAKASDVVQFQRSERHRLTADIGKYTLVAEIWQHTDPTHLSNEDDIVRLADDYSR